MLVFYAKDGTSREVPVDAVPEALPPEVIWLDLLKATPSETAFVERATGLKIPSLADLSEIEASSRLRSEHGVLYLSAPLVSRADSDDPRSTPVGFIVSPERLITIRFEPLTSFTKARDAKEATAGGVFAALIEGIVDRIADLLESIAAELDALSHRLFRSGPIKTEISRRPARENADLRAMLRRVGHGGDLASKIRDSLLGMARIVPYVASAGDAWLPADTKLRLETIRHDLASLSDYDAHLVNKVQLLLDATLGLINIEQNNIIKVLTVVSVVGVPPTLVASMYGMNFKHMPELDWAWGYPYGLALIAVSAIAPLLWFKWRGWL
ncbi:MAG TPA: magnesium transporter CorA family protein [Stellaceae bacterium]|jgi:magnesium transporter|nr:magnesium transporter CorA family protein [Stellaceae bacterium]